MDRSDVEILAKDIVYDGYFRIDRYRLRHRRHEGGWTGEITREVFERGHVAAVLPYDPERDAVVLIEQFRIGAWAAAKPCWLTEIVAGVIDDGESADGLQLGTQQVATSAEAVARREMEEETGCPVTALEPIGSYLSSPGGTSESVALFVGRVDSRKAGGIHGLPDENEDIKVLARPWSEVEAELKAGLFTNAATLIALQWLALNRDALRRRWG